MTKIEELTAIVAYLRGETKGLPVTTRTKHMSLLLTLGSDPNELRWYYEARLADEIAKQTEKL